MSVVAVKNGMIAADTYSRAQGVTAGSTKLWRQDEIAIGGTGYWDDCSTFKDWYFAGADMENLPKFHNREGHSPSIDFCALVLTLNGWEYWHDWMVPKPQAEFGLPYFAIGNGSQGAMVAMKMGASALEAVEACCDIIEGVRGPCESHRIEQVAVRVVNSP